MCSLGDVQKVRLVYISKVHVVLPQKYLFGLTSFPGNTDYFLMFPLVYHISPDIRQLKRATCRPFSEHGVEISLSVANWMQVTDLSTYRSLFNGNGGCLEGEKVKSGIWILCV